MQISSSSHHDGILRICTVLKGSLHVVGLVEIKYYAHVASLSNLIKFQPRFYSISILASLSSCCLVVCLLPQFLKEKLHLPPLMFGHFYRYPLNVQNLSLRYIKLYFSFTQVYQILIFSHFAPSVHKILMKMPILPLTPKLHRFGS